MHVLKHSIPLLSFRFWMPVSAELQQDISEGNALLPVTVSDCLYAETTRDKQHWRCLVRQELMYEDQTEELRSDIYMWPACCWFSHSGGVHLMLLTAGGKR